jgi:Domain of unknown function (DUF4345)
MRPDAILVKDDAMERRALQLLIVVAALVPVFGGGAGVMLGAQAFGPWVGAAEDSHVRYLSGLLLAIGLAYWACVPTIERRGEVVRLLTLMVLLGGVARLAGTLVAGDPGPTMRWALVMELLVAPAIGLWQARVARAASVGAPMARAHPVQTLAVRRLDAVQRPR